MDPRLAELYGTNQQTDEGDLEKAAAAEFAEGLAEEGELDVSELTDDDLEALAQEVLADGADEGAEVEEPSEEGEVAFSEEEQEKLAEADFVGRAMAHAYVAELREIEKQAGPIGDKMSAEDLKKAGEHRTLKQKGHDVVRAVKNSKVVQGAKKHGKRYGELLAGGEKPLSGSRRPGNFLKLHAKGSHWRSEQLKSLGARGGTAVGAALLAKGVHSAMKRKEKRASALDTLAEQRAMEILEASGIQEQETEVTQYDVLADAVEQRAAEMLAEAGYELAEE